MNAAFFEEAFSTEMQGAGQNQLEKGSNLPTNPPARPGHTPSWAKQVWNWAQRQGDEATARAQLKAVRDEWRWELIAAKTEGLREEEEEEENQWSPSLPQPQQN